MLFACKGSYADYEPPPRYTVKYEVTGTTSSVNIITDTDGKTEQYYNQSVPWVSELETYGGRSLYLSAQNNENAPLTSVTVTIYIDGVVHDVPDICTAPYCFAIVFGSTP